MKARGTFAQLQREVDTLRGQIEKLTIERESLLEAPIPKAEAMARVDEWISNARERFNSGILHAFTAREGGQVTPLIRSSITGGGHVTFGHVEEVLLAVVPDAIRGVLESELDRYYARRPGITDDAREGRLAEIEEELFVLEINEEQLITRAEAIGQYIPRRADADPRALVEACE
jgi:hypothetical protein